MASAQGQYRLVNQDTDSEAETTRERAKAMAKNNYVGDGELSRNGTKQEAMPRHGWTTRATCLFFSLILALMLLIGLIFVALHPTKTYNRLPPAPKSCQSLQCVTLAGQVASMANFSADPCHDFWQYACGKLLVDRVPEAYVSRWSWYFENAQVVREKLQKVILNVKTSNQTSQTADMKVAQLYRACTNAAAIKRDGVKPLQDFINSLGGWSASSWSSLKVGLSNALARVLPLRLEDITDNNGFSPFITVGPNKDPGANVSVFTINQNGLGMIARGLYLSELSNSVKVRAAYRQFMTKFADAMGSNAAEQAQRRRDMLEVFQFETNLSKMQIDVDSRSPHEMHHIFTVANLTEMVPQLDWELLLTSIAPNVRVTSDTIVNVGNPDYLRDLSVMFENTPQGILCNYIVWLVARMMSPLLSDELQSAFAGYKQALKGVPAEPRNLYCVRVVDKVVPLAVGRMFVDHLYKSSLIPMEGEIMSSVIAAFKANLPDVKWMDEATRKEAREKADGILYQIGYPLPWLNRSVVEREHLQLNVSTGSFFSDVLSARLFASALLARVFVIGQPVPRTWWDMRPTQVNAFYEPLWNVIGVPGATFQLPFFDPSAPAAINYGAVGTVMGHELSHAFDNQGRHYDKNGNLRQWWSNASSIEFDRRQQCLIDQYDRYTILGQHLRGEMALGENIADIGGLKIAYKAYRAHVKRNGKDLPLSGLPHMTGDKLFFLSHAQYQCSIATPQELLRRLRTDVHSPLKWRVMGPSIDVPEFAKVYNCPVGSTMNPKERCTIW